MRIFFKKIYNHYFYHMKLKSKFMLSHLILALLPTLMIAVFSYNQLFQIITQNTLRSLQAISEQTATSVEGTISHLNSVYNSMIEQDFFYTFIRNPNPEEFYGDQQFKKELNSFSDSMKYLLDDEVITHVRIFVDSKHYNLTAAYTDQSLFSPLSQAKGTYWNGIFQSTERLKLVCPTMYLSPSEIENFGDMAMIHKIPITTSKEGYVYVALYFNRSTLDSILIQDLPFTNSVIYINNDREAIVSTSNAALSGLYYLPHESIPESIPNTRKFETHIFAKEKVYVGYKNINNTDWYMITAIPYNNVFEEGSTLMLQFVTLYIGLLFISIFIALMLSSSIIRRISSVINQMKQVRSSAPVHLDVQSGSDEIGDLVDTYNYMTDEINLLLHQQKKSANDLRISEFKALESQINPHFLYNTLDMINWMAISGKGEEVSTAVQVMSRFYKLTLNRGNTIVLVRNELEHVSLYVKLLNMRYQNKIHFLIDVPDEMMEYSIPKLIFQPIVENSIQHGIFEKEEKEGSVIIMGWQEEDTLIFIVSDDGVGIPPEKINHLLDGTIREGTGSNIGIYNTHKRLQLFYNGDFGLSYMSTLGIETEVTIRIPAEKA